MTTSSQEVLALIDAGFSGVQRDETCTIHQAQLADESLFREISDNERMAARARDTEVNWFDVPASSIDECGAALSYATPASWLFYLPAFMKRTLELLDANAASNFPNIVIYHLTLDPGPPELRLYEFERFRQVTPMQERAILAFLQYIIGRSTTDDWFSNCAKEALDSYWGMPDRERFRGVESLS